MKLTQHTVVTTTIDDDGLLVLIDTYSSHIGEKITVRANARAARRAARLERLLADWPVKAEGSRGSSRDYFYWWVDSMGPDLQSIIAACASKPRSK